MTKTLSKLFLQKIPLHFIRRFHPFTIISVFKRQTKLHFTVTNSFCRSTKSRFIERMSFRREYLQSSEISFPSISSIFAQPFHNSPLLNLLSKTCVQERCHACVLSRRKGSYTQHKHNRLAAKLCVNIKF